MTLSQVKFKLRKKYFITLPALVCYLTNNHAETILKSVAEKEDKEVK